MHLKNIFQSGELDEKTVTEESSATAQAEDKCGFERKFKAAFVFGLR